MQLQLNLGIKKRIYLPIHYNHVVQGAIYNNLDQETAKKIHEVGFTYEKRSFRLFTFSRLMGRYQIDKKAQTISFDSDLKLVISSPLEFFCSSLLEHFLKVGIFRLGEYELEVIGVDIIQDKITDKRVRIRSLSPIVTYSTILKADHKKYTFYFQPGEPEFTRLVQENIAKKYSIIHKTSVPNGEIKILPSSQPRLSIINYKGTIIKGYMCNLVMEGPPVMLQVALDTGIGSKNSQGFGCVAIMGTRKSSKRGCECAN